MTTTQPPLKPGDRVLVEFEVLGDGCIVAVDHNGETKSQQHHTLAAFRWRPMSDPAQPRAVTFDIGDRVLIAGLDGYHLIAGIGYQPEGHVLYIDAVPETLPAADSPDAAHVARLEADLAAATAAFEAEHKAYLFVEEVTIRLGAEIGALQAEVDCMRPVVEALRQLVELKDGPRDAAYEAAKPAAWETARRSLNAVDAYRAGEKAPADAPSAPRSDETPAPLDESGSEAPGAQGGAEAVPVLAVDTPVLLADGPMPWRVATWDVVDDESGLSAIVGLRPMLAQPAPAPPKPTDAPGRRDWAGKIAEILDAALFDTKASKALAEHIVAALRLDELGEEFDAMAAALQRLDEANGEIGSPGQAVAWVLRDLEEARAERDFARKAVDQRITEQVIHWNALASAAGYKLDGSQEVPATLPLIVELTKQRNKVAGKYDALHADATALVAKLEARSRASGHIAWYGAADELRTLLAAPATTTPGGAGTATDGSEGGGK